MQIAGTWLILLILCGLTSLPLAAQPPVVKLKGLDGRVLDLEDLRGSPVVLAFGATWIPFARQSKPALQQLADRYTTRGVKFYWVSINSNRKRKRTFASDTYLQNFAEKHGLRVPILRDPDKTAFRALNLNAVPTLVLINRKGLVARRYVGFDTERPNGYQEVSRYLEDLLK